MGAKIEVERFRIKVKMTEKKLMLVQVEFIIVLKLEKWHLHNIQLLLRQPFELL